MNYKIFNALPDFLNEAAKKALYASEIDEKSGLISWPLVIRYEETEPGEKDLRTLTNNPPPGTKSYLSYVINLQAYEYLTATGWIYDPKHTGAGPMELVDNRKTS